MKVLTQTGWDHTDIHIDLPGVYKENYQINMIENNNINGLMKLSCCGREGQTRYTFTIKDGISMKEYFLKKEMKKSDVEKFTQELLSVVDELKKYLLDPEKIILSPDLIFLSEDKYYFCYIPLIEYDQYNSLSKSFHEMTEYFVKKMDYHDTEGVFLVYRMHRETLREGYELRKIMDNCLMEEKNRMKEQKKKVKKSRESLPDSAVFMTLEEENHNKYGWNDKQDAVMESKTGYEKSGYGILQKAIFKIKTGKWGEWNDLITEMDGKIK